MTELREEPPTESSTGEPQLPALTLADELEHLAPGWDLTELSRWPPDAFAFTATVLAKSGAYRCVVDPPAGTIWPPTSDSPTSWEERLRSDGRAWAEAAADPHERPPEPLFSLRESLAAALRTPIAELDGASLWGTLTDLLHLHTLADEACVGAGVLTETPFQRRSGDLLSKTGSLARLPGDRAHVLPKLRPPASGITLRSLSHHIALNRSEVEARWLTAPPPSSHPGVTDGLTLLLVPHPTIIRAGDFVPVRGSLANMDEDRWGFYKYQPQEPFDPQRVIQLVEGARRHVGDIDMLVLPEGALDHDEVAGVQRLLAEAGVPYLVAGARAPAEGGGFGSNYAHFGAGEWEAPAQHKHHRWCLDANQVHQYHLGAALDPRRQWWEAIGLPRRSLTFVTLSEDFTICPLVCEDLAQPDPVTDVIRSIAPTLVVALLLDGPQLAARWPARYASILADDPGCSVLTLTALGMAQRCQPPGFAPSRAIALWKDPSRGLQQISLAEDHHAVALTAHPRKVRVPSADGRNGQETAELVLSGIEQIAL